MIKVIFRSYQNKFQIIAKHEVYLPSKNGVIGILYNHENMSVSLKSGLVIIDNTSQYFVYDSIALINNNVIDIISDFIKEVNINDKFNIEEEITRINQNIKNSQTDTETLKYQRDILYYKAFQQFKK